MSVAAIILAAGASLRLGQPKQLLMHQGEILLSRQIRLARESGLTPVLVVLGAYSERIAQAIQRQSEIIVVNEQWEQGIASSIRAALVTLDKGAASADGALFITCDQPKLTSAHLLRLIEAFNLKAGSAIVASAYSGIRGIPAIFPRSTFPDLLRLEGDQGARKLLMNSRCPVETVEFAGGEIDIDHPSDLAQLE